MTKRIALIKLNKFLRDNQECSLYLGMPGSGKTTYVAYISYLCHIVGKRCFCNIPVKYSIPYTKDDLGVFDMSDSVILLDEAGIMYDNRQFSTAFSSESLTFLKYLRHYKCNIALFSQSNDIDVKWVRMSKQIFLIHRSLIPGFTSMSKVKRILSVNPDTHKLEDFYDINTSLLSRIRRFRFRRKPYYKFFDSWAAPKLPDMKSYDPYQWNDKEDYISFWNKLKYKIRMLTVKRE